MSEYIHLIGSEDVRAAGHRIVSAASDMNRAVGSLENALDRHHRFMDDWLDRFEGVIERWEYNKIKNKEGWL
jgi:hypothetical protein